MARMPGVTWVGPRHDNGTMTRYDVICIHTIVGRAPAHAAHFSTRSTGEILQSRDTVYRSAANKNGNHRVIAIENEDFGPAYGSWSGSNVPAFTDAQMWSIAKICAWANRTHGIPLVLCPDSRPGSRGIAYHRQGIDGNFGSYAYGGRVSGGEVWTDSFGKVCPGDRRIKQLIEVIIPRARQLASGGSPIQEDTLSWEDNLSLEGETYKAGDWLVRANQAAWLAANGVAAVNVKLDALTGDLDASEVAILSAIREEPTQVLLTEEQMLRLLNGIEDASARSLYKALAVKYGPEAQA